LEAALTGRAVAQSSPRAREAAAVLTAADFDALVREHQQRIYRVALGVTRDPDAADTITQECFLRAYRKRASFRGDSSVTTWLTRIAINLAIDHQRNRRNTFWRRLFGFAGPEAESGEAAALEVADGRASPERALLAREQVELVRAAVDALSGQQRAVFTLRFVEELSLEEVAAAMELEVGTVKAHLFRAVSAVRRKLRG
jgi:RNA polymerase sigma-70 factor (ECF subfamily)